MVTTAPAILLVMRRTLMREDALRLMQQGRLTPSGALGAQIGGLAARSEVKQGEGGWGGVVCPSCMRQPPVFGICLGPSVEFCEH